MNEPAIIVVFGATGDLFKRKIVPAICLLAQNKRLPEKFRVVGFGRRALNDETFKNYVATCLLTSGLESKVENVAHFSQLFSYVPGEFDDLNAFSRLNEALAKIDNSWSVASTKMFYFAVPPELFRSLFSKLGEAKLHQAGDANNSAVRVLIEKPFGGNLREAEELNKLLGSYFAEKDIYRVEHYLAKEVLRTFPKLRRNTLKFEKLLSPERVKHVHVRLFETIGVHDRGAFYDRVGAWRDVGENHLLQMLALCLMDLPGNFSAHSLQKARAMFIESLPHLTDAEIAQNTIRAQYQGYRNIKGVASDSTTETYFKVSFTLSGRFKDVSIMLESGKRLPFIDKSIEIMLTPNEDGATRVRVELEPSMRIIVEYTDESEHTLYEGTIGQNIRYATQYADLIMDALQENRTSFVSAKEVKAEWRFADPITDAWKRNMVSLLFYIPNKETLNDKRILDAHNEC